MTLFDMFLIYLKSEETLKNHVAIIHIHLYWLRSNYRTPAVTVTCNKYSDKFVFCFIFPTKPYSFQSNTLLSFSGRDLIVPRCSI